MNSFRLSRWTAALMIILGLCPAMTHAQRASARNLPLSIYKFSATDRRQNVVKTPQFASSFPKLNRIDKEWGRILLQYKTQVEWIDTMTIEYFVLSSKQIRGKNIYSLYTKKVTYTDIEKGDKHFSAVYLRPEALKRFGDVAAAAIEISVGGEVILKDSDISKASGVKFPSAEWWRDERVTGSSSTTKRSGYLLNKRESPWALINIDSYETIR